MPMKSRLALYRKLEKQRGRPLIAYVTSSRENSAGNISGDAVPEIQAQLQLLPKKMKALDLFLVSLGGDPTVAWRIVSLIRERVDKFSVLVPQGAFSAATLIVLGADEIVMHPNGNLGPTDPQITMPKVGKQPNEAVRFGSEDLAGFLKFAKDVVGIQEEALITQVFQRFCEEVGAVAVGVAARGAQLSVSMAEKLLQLHMKDEGKTKAKAIAQKLNKDFFHHGYPVNRSEAVEIGLKVAKADQKVEDLMWELWTNISEELALREPFNVIKKLRENPACAPLFAPVPVAHIPANLPPDVMGNLVTGLLAQGGISGVPPTPFRTVHALIESSRLASRFTLDGLVFASRLPDLNFKISHIVERSGWQTVYPGAKTAAATPPEAATPGVAPPPRAEPPPEALPAPAGTEGATADEADVTQPTEG